MCLPSLGVLSTAWKQLSKEELWCLWEAWELSDAP